MMLDDASRSHRRLDPAEGLQDAQLDTGVRFHGGRAVGVERDLRVRSPDLHLGLAARTG
jgi:hypothetical protein